MADAIAAEPSSPVPQVIAKRHHIVAATLGNALEFYDFITYAYFSIQIGHAFFPSKSHYLSLMLSLGAFGAGFLTRPIGGFVLGAYADKRGRRASMMLSYLMMGCAITAIAVIPPYARIGLWAPVLALLARMVQGFSLGGELGSVMAFLTEASPPEKRGRIVAWQGAGQLIAASSGALVGLILSSTLPAPALDSYGWRIAFLIGALTVPVGLILRRTLPETLHAAEAPAPAAKAGPRGNVRLIVLGVMILGGGTIATYVLDYMTTFAEDSLHLGTQIAFLATMLPNFFAIPAALGGGIVSDRVGRKPVMVFAQGGFLLLTLPVFFLMVREKTGVGLVAGACLLSFVQTFGQSGFYPAFTESLPKAMRSRAMGATYACSIAAFGGSTQLIIRWLIHLTGRPEAPGVYMFAGGLMGLLGMSLMLESAPGKGAVAAPVPPVPA